VPWAKVPALAGELADTAALASATATIATKYRLMIPLLSAETWQS
jgi:hypothetical protein